MTVYGSQFEPLRREIERLRGENARLTRERDALTRGEDTPSLDAIRAHGGVWVVTDGSTATTLSLRVDAATVYAVDACGCDLRYDAERFTELHAGCRWWRVRGDGTLALDVVDVAGVASTPAICTTGKVTL